jgi:MoaA/NifB/PqqE/SkfB family radical SAM enzyme
MEHIERGKKRLEDLWAKGTDYSNDIVEKAKKENKMLHLDMDLTGDCQLKCFYCDRTPDRFNKIPNRIELSTAERKDLITQAQELGAQTVEFPGAGEPMIDKGFWEIIEFINKKGMISVLFTSGYHLDQKSISRLYDNNVTIFLKYNHTDFKIQDKMVNVKGFGKISNQVLFLLINHGFNKEIPTRLAIDMVVTPKFQDIEEVKKIFRWCRQNNIHSYISTLIPEGIADHKSKILERERSNQLLSALQKIDQEDFGLIYTPSRPLAGGYRCRQVNIGLHINLFGECYDCNGLGRFLGHVKKNSLSEIWTAKFSQHIRKPNQDGFCLLRERVWNGVETKGMDRKLEQYLSWKKKYGEDPILLSGLKHTGYLGKNKK